MRAYNKTFQTRDPKFAAYSEAFVDALSAMFGGERGIRTPETLAGLHAFQACALGHYATSPFAVLNYLISQKLAN